MGMGQRTNAKVQRNLKQCGDEEMNNIYRGI